MVSGVLMMSLISEAMVVSGRAMALLSELRLSADTGISSPLPFFKNTIMATTAVIVSKNSKAPVLLIVFFGIILLIG